MNNLKTSTKVLIALIAAALVLGAVLLLTIPEPWVDSFKETHSFIFDGTAPDFDYEDGEQFRSFHNFDRSFRSYDRDRYTHSFGGIIFVGLILILIFKGKRFHGRRNHSKAIIDRLYAEEKISREEYKRRKTVIEEEGK